MSENDIPNNGQFDPAAIPQAPAAPTMEAPAAAAPTFRDQHTADNTTMSKVVESREQFTKDIPAEEVENELILTFFTGNTKANQAFAREILAKWRDLAGARQAFEAGRADQSYLNGVKAIWDGFVTENFPTYESIQVEHLAERLYDFTDNFLDGISVRSRVMVEENISNVSDRGGVVTPDIVAKRPGASSKGFSLSDAMRRSAMRTNKQSFQYDVLLRNSFTMLSFARPNKLEMGQLMNDIANTVAGYVQRVNSNNLSLARIAGYKAIWNFLKGRIVHSSVKDIIDFNDLLHVIRLNDMDTLCMALMCASTDDGVNLRLHCLSDKCAWSKIGLVDPALMVRIRQAAQTNEEAAVYANLLNGKVAYSVEETLELSDATTYGGAETRVYGEDNSIYFELGAPTLAQAFDTFDYFISEINPRLAELRTNTLNPTEYETQVALLLNNLGATEYLHWIKAMTTVAPTGSDEEDVTYSRKTDDGTEFNKGLMNVLMDDPVLNKAVINFIFNKTPFMTHTFVGVADYNCPDCKKNMSEFTVREDHRLGYTPIDAFMAFFTHTQLTTLNNSVTSRRVIQEALSN